MAGFVPGRDRFTIEGVAPAAAEQATAAELADVGERRAALDREELADLERADLERAQMSTPPARPKRSLLDRLLRRG